MYQHCCGTFLDEEDTILGICPGCLDFLAASSNTLRNFSLDQLVNILRGEGEVFDDLNNEEESRIVINEEPEDITLDLNPTTGAYEAQTELQTV